eukprot:scaffold2.g7292.t1
METPAGNSLKPSISRSLEPLPASSSEIGLLSIPDDVLDCILCALPQYDARAAVPLVCRRFLYAQRRASPKLFCQLHLVFSRGALGCDIYGFLAWMEARGHCVRQLELELSSLGWVSIIAGLLFRLRHTLAALSIVLAGSRLEGPEAAAAASQLLGALRGSASLQRLGVRSSADFPGCGRAALPALPALCTLAWDVGCEGIDGLGALTALTAMRIGSPGSYSVRQLEPALAQLAGSLRSLEVLSGQELEPGGLAPLARLTGLRALVLSCRLRALPADVGALTGLARLCLTHNRLGGGGAGGGGLSALAALARLRELALARNGLARLPAAVAALGGRLTALSLAENDLTSLRGLEQLRCLRRLDLSAVSLADALPPEAVALPALEYLDVRWNAGLAGSSVRGAAARRPGLQVLAA